MTETTRDGWDRECVVCGHKWQETVTGGEECPSCASNAPTETTKHWVGKPEYGVPCDAMGTDGACALCEDVGHDQRITEFVEEAAKRRWNAKADQFNQWSELGQDERDELIAAEIQS